MCGAPWLTVHLTQATFKVMPETCRDRGLVPVQIAFLPAPSSQKLISLVVVETYGSPSLLRHPKFFPIETIQPNHTNSLQQFLSTSTHFYESIAITVLEKKF